MMNLINDLLVGKILQYLVVCIISVSIKVIFSGPSYCFYNDLGSYKLDEKSNFRILWPTYKNKLRLICIQWWGNNNFNIILEIEKRIQSNFNDGNMLDCFT